MAEKRAGSKKDSGRNGKHKSIKSSKVNKIISLFEIPRPSKNKTLHRTNSLPVSRPTSLDYFEDGNINTQSRLKNDGLFSSKYNETSGRVKKIKDEIERKNTEETEKYEIISKSRGHKKRQICELECKNENILEFNLHNKDIKELKDAKAKGDGTMNLEKSGYSSSNIKYVSEHTRQSDNYIDITRVALDVLNLFKKKGSGENFTENNNDCDESIQNNGDEDVFTLFNKESNEFKDDYKIGDGDDDDGNLETHSVEFINESLTNHFENETEESNYDNQELGENEVDTPWYWSSNRSKLLGRSKSENVLNIIGRVESESESGSVDKESKERQGMFVKNHESIRSKRLERRTGILQASNPIKFKTNKFENFMDAELKGERETYRKSLIFEMDQHFENMKLDGFKEDIYLSYENLNLQDATDSDVSDDAPELVILVNQEHYDTEIEVNSSETTPVFEPPEFFPDSLNRPSYENVASTLEVDDEFGEMLFGEDLEHGLYFLEAFNADGKELVIVNMQVDRKSVQLDTFDEMKFKSDLLVDQNGTLLLIGNDEACASQMSLNDSNNDSKRTTIYSTTSGDSFDDRNDDDEGIDIENSADLYRYNGARRETYCDNKGVIRIERVGPFGENVEEAPEYMEIYNNYYVNEEEPEESNLEENYYECIRLEQQICISAPEVKKETLQYILEEIKVTETKYVDDLEKVLFQYRPFIKKACRDKVGEVFGNIKEIYFTQKTFLRVLEDAADDVRSVVQAFIDFEDLFQLYPRYFRNTPKANAAVRELASVIKEKQEQINDKLDLTAYLLTPLQRLGKYKLFLENITKQLEKENKSTGAVTMALEIVKKYMSKGNDAVAIASISNSPLHSEDYGSFITREKFMLIKPKRLELMVFLFDGAIVFTIEDQRNMEHFIYWQSIKTNDLRIATFEDTFLHLTDYTKTKRRNSSKYTYVLDVKTQKLKETWRGQIEDILWRQLQKVKENTLKEYRDGKKVPKKLGRNRVKSAGSSVFYVE